MLVSEIIQSSIPVLHYDDTVEDAIELLQQNNIEHLPVLHNDNYEGLVSMDELLSAEETDVLSMLSNKLIHISISYNQHILSALKLITESGSIKGRTLIYATHIPPGINLVHLRCAPYRSYAMQNGSYATDTYAAVCTV